MSLPAPEEDTYKGHPVLKIYHEGLTSKENHKHFYIGVKKARAIIECFDYVRRFAKKHRGDKT